MPSLWRLIKFKLSGFINIIIKYFRTLKVILFNFDQIPLLRKEKRIWDHKTFFLFNTAWSTVIAVAFLNNPPEEKTIEKIAKQMSCGSDLKNILVAEKNVKLLNDIGNFCSESLMPFIYVYFSAFILAKIFRINKLYAKRTIHYLSFFTLLIPFLLVNALKINTFYSFVLFTGAHCVVLFFYRESVFAGRFRSYITKVFGFLFLFLFLFNYLLMSIVVDNFFKFFANIFVSIKSFLCL